MNEGRAALIIDEGRSEKIAVLNSYIFLPWTTKTRVITSSAPNARRMLHGPPFGGISYRGRVLKENVKWLATSSSSDSDSGDECSNNIASQDPKYSGTENGKL